MKQKLKRIIDLVNMLNYNTYFPFTFIELIYFFHCYNL